MIKMLLVSDSVIQFVLCISGFGSFVLCISGLCGLSLSALRLLTMPRLLEWGIQLSADIPKVEEVHRESFVSDLIRSCTSVITSEVLC